jgi:hypothetical protein
MLGLLEHLGVLPDWVIPDPVGEPPQLETVQVDYATHTIHWTVTGNASQVDHFLIDHVLLRPDLAVPIVEAIGDPIEVAADQRSAPLPMGAIMLAGTPDELTRSYLAVRVTMVPTDPAVGVDPGLAPAAPVRPMVVAPHLNVMPDADFVPAGGPPGHLPVGFGGQPELPGPAAWLAGELATQNGLVFAGLSPHQHHVVARAQHDGDEMTVACAGFLLPGTYRFIALVGFQGAVEHHVAAHVHANVRLTSVLNPALPPADFGGDAAAEADPALPPAPLVPLIIDVNTAGVGAGPMAFRVTFRFVQIDVDPQHPPVLVGLRLLGM